MHQLASCAKDLREVSQYEFIDYHKIDSEYGRDAAKPDQTYSDRMGSEEVIGSRCKTCPVESLVGECAMKVSLRQLASEHREKYDLPVASRPGWVGTGVEAITLFDEDQAIDYEYEAGWNQEG